MTVIFFRILILKWYSVFLFWESFTVVNFNVIVIHTLIIVIFSCRRSVSDMNTNDQSDIDSVLEGISTQLAQIDSNIGDVNTYLNYPSWCFINLLSLSLGKQILLCCHPQVYLSSLDWPKVMMCLHYLINHSCLNGNV